MRGASASALSIWGEGKSEVTLFAVYIYQPRNVPMAIKKHTKKKISGPRKHSTENHAAEKHAAENSKKAFARKAYSQTVFIRKAYSRKAFTRKAYSRKAFTRKAFKRKASILHHLPSTWINTISGIDFVHAVLSLISPLMVNGNM